ncbi:MAG: hypothetical protein AAGC84_06810 [Pseudomonas sp.]
MKRVEAVLVGIGVLLLALGVALLVANSHFGGCVDVLGGGCEEVGFAYEGGGKLALLLGFILFLLAALHGLFSSPDNRNR